MKAYMFAMLLLLTFVLSSCNKDDDLSNHNLVGLYSGMWDTNISMVDIEIAASIEKEELEFSLSIFRSHSIELQSDSEFTIPRFEENGTSIGIRGELIGDTLYIDNNYFNVIDPTNSGIRLGKFVRVE